MVGGESPILCHLALISNYTGLQMSLAEHLLNPGPVVCKLFSLTAAVTYLRTGKSVIILLP